MAHAQQPPSCRRRLYARPSPSPPEPVCSALFSPTPPLGRLPTWNDKDAPDIAKTYWGLAPDATMRDVLLAVRADEANHRDVNHTLSSIKADDINPFVYREATADPRDKHSSASLPAEEAQRRQRAV